MRGQELPWSLPLSMGLPQFQGGSGLEAVASTSGEAASPWIVDATFLFPKSKCERRPATPSQTWEGEDKDDPCHSFCVNSYLAINSFNEATCKTWYQMI